MSERDARAHLARMGQPMPEPTRRKRTPGAAKPGSKAEEALCGFLTLLGIDHRPQYPWGKELDPPRKYVSDAAIPSARLLIEIDGGVHGIEDKRARDLERQNLGTFAGWRFLRFLPAQAESGEATLVIQRFIDLNI